MSDKSNEQTSNGQGPAAKPDGALGRRLFIFRAATILSGAAAVAGSFGGARRAKAQQTDSDPSDKSGEGKGGSGSSRSNTDSDPSDAVGSGKSTKAKDGNGPRTSGPEGCTDSDPTDKASHGKKC